MLEFHTGHLSELLKQKGLSEDEKRKIILTTTALNLIAVAVGKEGSNHKLSEEMHKLEDYVKLIDKAVSQAKVNNG